MADPRKIVGVVAHFPAGSRAIRFAGAGLDEEFGLPFVDEIQNKEGAIWRHFNVPFSFDLSPPQLVQPVNGVLKS